MPTVLQPNFDASLHQMVQAIVTVLAVINPVVCGSIFLTLTPQLLPTQRRRAAVRVAFSILIILLAAALIGLKVLSAFNISIDAFQIVGGMIIAFMGFDMLRGGQTVGQAPPTDDATTSPSLAPGRATGGDGASRTVLASPQALMRPARAWDRSSSVASDFTGW